MREKTRASSLTFHDLITPPALVCLWRDTGSVCVCVCVLFSGVLFYKRRQDSTSYRTKEVQLKMWSVHHICQGDEVTSLCPKWHSISIGGQSITSLWRLGHWGGSYLLTPLMEDSICISLSKEGAGTGQQTSRPRPDSFHKWNHSSQLCLPACTFSWTINVLLRFQWASSPALSYLTSLPRFIEGVTAAQTSRWL